MAKALVICFEGQCEQAFFSALLEKEGFFCPPKLTHNYYKQDSFILLPPCSGARNKVTGKQCLTKKEKYAFLAAEIDSLICAQGLKAQSRTLSVCFDTESPDADYADKEASIRQQAEKCFSHAGDIFVHPVSGSIENWFIAGLTTVIPKVKNTKDYNNLIQSHKPDKIHDAKKQFYDCFDNADQITLISRLVGENFNTQEALKLSPTFKKFYTEVLGSFLNT